MDELSAKYIEVSEKLEQWDLWWQEASTIWNAREAENTGIYPEGLKTIAEEERRPQPTTPFVQSQPTIPQEFLPPPLPPKFAHKNFPKRANESDESSHTGMDPQAVPTFAAPTTPPSAHKHTPPTMTSAPPSPFAGPWAATREKLQSSNPVMDYHSCPGSGGISDASTLPMHPPPGMGYATPMPSTPVAYACPAMRTTGSSQQVGAQQGRITSDEVRKDRSPESFVNSPTPQEGSTVQRNLAKGVTSNKGVASDNPNKAPILDTGATRCLLRLSWISEDVIDKAERIHLGVANGTRSRALLWNNIMYSPHTARPLI